MQWGEPGPLYGPWDTSEHKASGLHMAQFDDMLRKVYGPGLRAAIEASSSFNFALGREMAAAADSISEDLGKQMFGIKMVTDAYCPPDTAYLLNSDHLFIASPYEASRNRFWYKPWTWLRKNRKASVPWMQDFSKPVNITGLEDD